MNVRNQTNLLYTLYDIMLLKDRMNELIITVLFGNFQLSQQPKKVYNDIIKLQLPFDHIIKI